MGKCNLQGSRSRVHKKTNGIKKASLQVHGESCTMLDFGTQIDDPKLYEITMAELLHAENVALVHSEERYIPMIQRNTTRVHWLNVSGNIGIISMRRLCIARTPYFNLKWPEDAEDIYGMDFTI